MLVSSLFVTLVISSLLILPLNALLLRAVWQHHAVWARQHSLPRSLLATAGFRRLAWTLMMFDPNLQVTPQMRVVAKLSGLLHYTALLCIILLLCTSAPFAPPPFQ